MTRMKVLREAGAATGSDFLDLVKPEERSIRRLAATLLLGAPLALVAALIATVACMFAAAQLTGRHVDETLALVTGPETRGARSLLSYGVELSIAGLASIAVALALLFVASKVQRRAPLTFLTARPRLRISLFLGGLAAGAALVGLALIVERTWSSQPVSPPILTPGADWGERAGYAAMAAGFLFLAALAEEIVFRGWFVQQLGAWTRNVAIMLTLNGLVFSFVHFDPDISGFLIRCLMGAGWAWIAIRTAGVEFTTGFHLANNLLVSLFVMPAVFAAQPASSVNLAAVALEGVVIVALVAGVEAWLRVRPGEAGPAAGAQLRLRR